MDYALASTLGQYVDSRLPIEINYDIACKYSIHIVDRFERSFPELVPLIKNAVFYVPDMHVKAHILACQKQFKREFGPKTGKADAEGSERFWSGLNEIAPSISEMNLEHHNDVFDDHGNAWNAQKLSGICELCFAL